MMPLDEAKAAFRAAGAALDFITIVMHGIGQR
jgi:hypothetical protein